jgi:hypothetical protein
MAKGEIHYIEVETDSVDSEEEQDNDPLAQRRSHHKQRRSLPRDHRQREGPTQPVAPQPPEQANRRKPTKGGVITTLSGVPRYDTLWIKGTIQGQQTIALIDGGATHNFIDV